MSNVSTSVGREVIIDSLPVTSKKINACSHWVFTWNNYKEEKILPFLNIVLTVSTLYAFQEEIGEKCGTPHIQGYISFKKRTRPFSEFPPDEYPIDWDVRKAKTHKQAYTYCLKDETRKPNGRRWTNAPIVLDDWDHPYYDWQQEILDIIETKPDKRSIYWYWESIGNVGKTTFARHLVLTKKVGYCDGKGADIKCAVKTVLEGGKNISTMIFDFTRATEGKISYHALEAIKNAIFFSGKYESSWVVTNYMHVIVFANFPPDESRMSSDRWIIKNIGPAEPCPPATSLARCGFGGSRTVGLFPPASGKESRYEGYYD